MTDLINELHHDFQVLEAILELLVLLAIPIAVGLVGVGYGFHQIRKEDRLKKIQVERIR